MAGALARMLPRALALLTVAAVAVLAATPALAQQVNIDLGEQGTFTGRLVQIMALVTVLTLAPSLLITMTSFTRIVIVLSLIRSAIGVQQTPPNVVIIGLALFLTAYVMGPTFEKVYDDGIQPLMADQINEVEAFNRSMAPIHTFMMSAVREKDLGLFMQLSGAPDPATREATPLRALIPAFMISELKRAFEIGFLIFVPFIVIDMVVASVLMSMGMMMLPPIMISLPFKLIFFVLVDGWSLIATSLVQSFNG
jgi:flagellar biosynthetic protein FliP